MIYHNMKYAIWYIYYTVRGKGGSRLTEGCRGNPSDRCWWFGSVVVLHIHFLSFRFSLCPSSSLFCTLKC